MLSTPNKISLHMEGCGSNDSSKSLEKGIFSVSLAIFHGLNIIIHSSNSKVLIWNATSRSAYNERDESNQDKCLIPVSKEKEKNRYQLITINLAMLAFQFQEYWFGMQDRARLIRNGTNVTR